MANKEIAVEKSGNQQEKMATSSNESSEVDVAEAARVLSVSRPYLRKLVEKGKLPGVRFTDEGEVRIARADLLAYKERQRASQRKALEELAEASQRFGLYGAELQGTPKRGEPE